MMKSIRNIAIFAILLGAIGYSGYFIYNLSLSPCDKPLEYSIGRFDTQFGISQESFKSYIVEAGKVWEDTLNRKVFIYNPKADFKINLIYDERQLATVQKQKTEFGLSAVESAFKQLDANFSVFKSQYENKVSAYEESLALYENRKAAYDKEVEFWNSRQGAPKDKYDALNAERQYLNTEASRLNNEASAISTMVKELNSLLEDRNKKAAEYNKIAEEYNKKYKGGLEFNQAEYTGKEINVYQFGNKKDLILALSHELGHALGMDHVENPKSIMYYITGINSEVSPSLSVEDLTELKRVCKI